MLLLSNYTKCIFQGPGICINQYKEPTLKNGVQVVNTLLDWTLLLPVGFRCLFSGLIFLGAGGVFLLYGSFESLVGFGNLPESYF